MLILFSQHVLACQSSWYKAFPGIRTLSNISYVKSFCCLLNSFLKHLERILNENYSFHVSLVWMNYKFFIYVIHDIKIFCNINSFYVTYEDLYMQCCFILIDIMSLTTCCYSDCNEIKTQGLTCLLLLERVTFSNHMLLTKLRSNATYT